MEINKRELEILNFILMTPNVETKMIEDKYSLTRNQIDYSLRKINGYLEDKGRPLVTRTRSGTFVIDKNDSNLFGEVSLSAYEFSKHERMYLLILMMLSNNTELNLMYLSYQLKVSETTISRDISVVTDYINNYKLDLENYNGQGYEIIGREWNIRKLLSNVVNYIYNNMVNGELLLKKFGDISEKEVTFYKKEINYIEKKLSIKYSENNIWIAPYILSLIIRRISKGQTVQNEFNIAFEGLSDTKEYFAISEMFDEKMDTKLPNQEKMYITLYLMTLNVSEIYHKENFTELNSKINEFLELFENNYAIKLINKKELKKKLYIHLSSAIYRIKYNFLVEYPVIPKYSNEDKDIISLVKNTIDPLEQLIGKKFPYKELYFISSLIGGNLYSLNKESNVEYFFDAVIVCPNGLLFANLIKEKLKEILPFVNFKKSMSLEEFQMIDGVTEKYDFVFSSVYIAEEKVIVIDNSFDDIEKQRLKRLVANKINPNIHLEKFVEKILEIVSSHTLLFDKAKEYINKDIQSLLQVVDDVKTKNVLNEEKEVKKRTRITEVLREENIQVTSKDMTWSDAIQIASGPLLEKGYINANYIEAMKAQFPQISKNILLGKHAAIPHSKAENGSYGLGISLLKLKSPLIDLNDNKIYFVFVVSTTSSKKQLNVMYQLLKLVTDEKVMDQLISSKTSEEILGVIENFENSSR